MNKPDKDTSLSVLRVVRDLVNSIIREININSNKNKHHD